MDYDYLTSKREDRIVYSMPGHAPSLVTTIAPNGTVNVGAFEQTMLCSNVPPVIILAVSPKSDTLHNLRDHRECVIGYPYPASVQKVYDAGVRLPRGISEVELVGFNTEPAVTVEPPRLRECWFVAEGQLLWEQDSGDHVACGISVNHVALDASFWDDDYKNRRVKLPALYYTVGGNFFEVGDHKKVQASSFVRNTGHAG